MKVKLLSRVQLLANPWTAADQAPLSIGFSRQEYWSGVSSPSPSIASFYKGYCLWTMIQLSLTIYDIKKSKCVEVKNNHNSYQWEFLFSFYSI